jgi:hypothetical protein
MRRTSSMSAPRLIRLIRKPADVGDGAFTLAALPSSEGLNSLSPSALLFIGQELSHMRQDEIVLARNALANQLSAAVRTEKVNTLGTLI